MVALADDKAATVVDDLAVDPAVVLSDLNMPEMSGFELFSEVRQQFPNISLVAMSGNYETGEEIPGGVIADAFYPKGYGNPGVLLRILSEMISQSESRIH